MANFRCHWTNFCCRGPNVKKIIQPSGHTDNLDRRKTKVAKHSFTTVCPEEDTYRTKVIEKQFIYSKLPFANEMRPFWYFKASNVRSKY